MSVEYIIEIPWEEIQEVAKSLTSFFGSYDAALEAIAQTVADHPDYNLQTVYNETLKNRVQVMVPRKREPGSMKKRDR